MTSAHSLLSAVVTPRQAQTEALDYLSGLHGRLARGLASAGQLPTGTGKSYVALCAAAERAAVGETTVISTGSLALQKQYERTAPAVATAYSKKTGKSLDVKVLKGFSNYPCGFNLLENLEGEYPWTKRLSSENEQAHLTRVREKCLTEAQTASTPEARRLLEAAVWILDNLLRRQVVERSDLPKSLPDAEWKKASTTTQDCIGETCWLADRCAARLAKENASKADIVITNHYLLAAQASYDVPVFYHADYEGNPERKCLVDHFILDEAHTFPSVVREQSQKTVSARKLRSIAKSSERIVVGGINKHYGLTIADRIAVTFDGLYEEGRKTLSLSDLGSHSNSPYYPSRYEALLSSLLDIQKDLSDWVESVHAVLQGPLKSSDESVKSKAESLLAKTDKYRTRFNAAVETRDHLTYWLRPEEADRTKDFGDASDFVDDSPSAIRESVEKELVFASADVSGYISGRLWQLPVETHRPGSRTPRRGVSRTLISGTLTKARCEEMGVPSAAFLKDWDTPFKQSFKKSAIYLPVVTEEIATRLFPLKEADYPGSAKKAEFDRAGHTAWVIEQAVPLIQACSGGVLVLSATSSDAKEITEALRRSLPKGSKPVFSQYGKNLTKEKAVAEWLARDDSVLVGTKSFMTGIDAAGRTCRLVIIDRPPRPAGNPIDDARAGQYFPSRKEIDWLAKDDVYAGDAAVLLEQAAGRLIRTPNDYGMVAVLDPRLAYSRYPYRIPPFSYSNRGTAIDHYRRALREFLGESMTPAPSYRADTLSQAEDWLRRYT